jgi:hypothetical protein
VIDAPTIVPINANEAVTQFTAQAQADTRDPAAVDHRPTSGYLLTGVTTGARPGSVEVSGGVARLAAVHCGVGVTHSWHVTRRAPGVERLKRGVPSSK